MRWLIVLPFDRPGHMGVDFADELSALGHEVRTFAYRRDNALYKNTGSQALYQRWISRRLERLGLAWRPALTLVIKGGPSRPTTSSSPRSATRCAASSGRVSGTSTTCRCTACPPCTTR